MKAIVTVLGNDNVGIIAMVCSKLSEYNINILDISQTILQDKFTMIMAVDLEKANTKFMDVAKGLKELGESRNLSIHIQREEIFNAMHTI